MGMVEPDPLEKVIKFEKIENGRSKKLLIYCILFNNTITSLQQFEIYCPLST